MSQSTAVFTFLLQKVAFEKPKKMTCRLVRRSVLRCLPQAGTLSLRPFADNAAALSVDWRLPHRCPADLLQFLPPNVEVVKTKKTCCWPPSKVPDKVLARTCWPATVPESSEEATSLVNQLWPATVVCVAWALVLLGMWLRKQVKTRMKIRRQKRAEKELMGSVEPTRPVPPSRPTPPTRPVPPTLPELPVARRPIIPSAPLESRAVSPTPTTNLLQDMVDTGHLAGIWSNEEGRDDEDGDNEESSSDDEPTTGANRLQPPRRSKKAPCGRRRPFDPSSYDSDVREAAKLLRPGQVLSAYENIMGGTSRQPTLNSAQQHLYLKRLKQRGVDLTFLASNPPKGKPPPNKK